MNKRLLLLSLLLLSACLPEETKETVSLLAEKRENAALAIEQKIGIKPTIGFQYKNGVYTQISVFFNQDANIENIAIADIRKASQEALKEHFDKKPLLFIISFAIKPDQGSE